MALLSQEQAYIDAQERRNKMLFEQRKSANERFMADRAAFIGRNPGAVSPLERESTLGYARKVNDREALQEHELKMLEGKNAGELAVASQKRLGMAEQGMRAAEETAGAERHKADIGLKQAENEWATRQLMAEKELAQKESASARTAATEKYKADAGVDAAQVTAAGNVSVQAEKNKAMGSQVQHEMIMRDLDFEQKKVLQKMRIDGQRANADDILMANMLMKTDKITFEEAMKKVIAMRASGGGAAAVQ